MPKKYTVDQLAIAHTACRCGAKLACPRDLAEEPLDVGGSAWSCSKRWTDPEAFDRDSYVRDKDGNVTTATGAHDPAYPFDHYPHLGIAPKA